MSARIDHESRRLEIAYKAMKLFSQVGYDNVTLIMIASSAGVARTVLYRYFRSKREVLDAAILATTRQIMQECSREIAKRGKAADRLSMVCFHVADVLFDKKELRQHQQEALEAARKGLATADRGKLIKILLVECLEGLLVVGVVGVVQIMQVLVLTSAYRIIVAGEQGNRKI